EGQVQIGFAPEYLDAATGVGAIVFQDGVARLVADAARQAPRAAGLALNPYTAHKSRACRAWRSKAAQKIGNVGRVVLAIAIHRGDDRAPSGEHPRPDGCALAGPFPMTDVAKFGIDAD